MKTVKRYLVFAGDRYYPKGGWHDFYQSEETYEKALSLVKPRAMEKYEWIQIVDGETGTVLYKLVRKDEYEE